MYEEYRNERVHETVNHCVCKVAATNTSTVHNLLQFIKGCFAFADKYCICFMSYMESKFIFIFVKTLQNLGCDHEDI